MSATGSAIRGGQARPHLSRQTGHHIRRRRIQGDRGRRKDLHERDADAARRARQGALSRKIETIAYLIEGECAVYYGDDLERRVVVNAGDHVFCPADVPHAPSNESGKPCTWLVVHSSGSDQDGIVLLPELDAKLTARA